jgi:flagellar transcriptional activator FlhC
MKAKSVVNETKQLQLAIDLIKLGARLQLLESQTTLSREKLTKLYKELRGSSPPKGMLPFSTDWFLTWQPDIHSSMFMNIYFFLKENAGASGINLLIKSYRLYLEQSHGIELTGEQPVSDEPVLSLIRAWTLVRFVEKNLLKMESCTCCHGKFVVDTYDLHESYRCNLCHIPSRAGKYQKDKKPKAELAKVKKSKRSKVKAELVQT